MDTNNDITKGTELRSMQCLYEVTTNHVQSGTEYQIFLLLREYISDKIISDIDMSCLLAT